MPEADFGAFFAVSEFKPGESADTLYPRPWMFGPHHGATNLMPPVRCAM